MPRSCLRVVSAVVAACLLTPGSAWERQRLQEDMAHQGHEATTGELGATDHAMNMGCGDTTCVSTAAFMRENMAMHEGMAIEFTCDPEIDFVRGMIPHHQGAVTMCEILRDAMSSDGSGGMDQGGDMHHGHGDTMGRRRAQDMSSEMGLDSYLDQLCTDISASQEAEIAAMEGWLADKGVAVATSCAHASSGDQAADSEPATCEFEALMAAVQAAIEHGDPSMLADSPYYQSCEEVRPMIERANVVIGATCP